MKNTLPTRFLALVGLCTLGAVAPAAAQTPVFIKWPLTSNLQDVAAQRSANTTVNTPTFRRYVLSDGQLPAGNGNQAFPAYSSAGQAFAPAADGGGWSSSSATPPGTGSTPRRRFYEQFSFTATGASLRVDSITFNMSVFNSAAGKVAIGWSRSNFTADSSETTGGKGPAIANSVNTRPGGVLAATENGTFGINQATGNPGDIAYNGALLPQQTTAGGVADYFSFALNGATGITVPAGQTLTIRVYVGVGSSSMGRYVLLRNVTLKSRQAFLAAATAHVVKNGLSIAPNPATAQVVVNHPVAKAGGQVSVYTTTGQKVTALATQTGSEHTALNLDKLAAGLYLVEYGDGEQRVTSRFVKQ